MMPRIAHFNDGFRDAVKGDIFHFEYKGFVSGGGGLLHKVKQGIVGGIRIPKMLRRLLLSRISA